MTASKIVLNAASGVGGAGLDVDEVFSTNLYTGTNSALTVNTGLDQNTEGGMLWVKSRSTSSTYHGIWDTERTNGYYLGTNSTANQGNITAASGTNPFLRDGSFRWNSGHGWFNQSGEYVAWAFRKAPKFFDVVTWTGNSTAGRTISHNLEAEIGFIAIKCTSASGDWMSWHRSASSYAGRVLKLNATDGATNNSSIFNSTNPTSTEFTLGSSYDVNGNGQTYVAYLFAHNNNDGEFGPDADQDIIKCGSFTTDGSGFGQDVNLGWEPQWLLVKRKDSASGGDWKLIDTMRGYPAYQANNSATQSLEAEDTAAEATQIYGGILSGTGFKIQDNASAAYIYIAIRRGPLAPPESGTDVLNIGTRNESGNAPPMYYAGRVVDMAWQREVTTSNNPTIISRLTGNNYLRAYDPSTFTSSSTHVLDYSDGWYNGTETNTNAYSYMFSRAVGAFDVVAYTGNGTSGNGIQHGLGVAPEFIMIHSYGNRNWQIGSQLLDNQAYGYTESSYMHQGGAGNSIFPNTSHTSTHFYVGSDADVNGNNEKYIAHLWASVDNVIKCGVYTGNGSTSRDIDCGFTSGARFVLLGNCDDSDYSRILFDTERGITTGAGDHPSSFFFPVAEGYVNSPSGYVDLSTTDFIDPISSGFRIKSNSAHINASGKKYLYMAIA